MVDEVIGVLAGANPAKVDADSSAAHSDLTGRRILDCTLGGGGHSAALLAAGADVTGVDRDSAAIAEAGARLKEFADGGRFRAVLANYADYAEGPAADATFDGILLDLGVSSHQFDDEARGFSFREGAPLDMRMAGAAGTVEFADGGSEFADSHATPEATAAAAPTAAEWLNESPESEIADVLRDYGDERRAARMAAEIVRRRGNQPFAISDDLVGAIRAVLGPRSGAPDFARIFQAVRIAVNDELGGLARALPALRDRLAPSGVIGVITYHSGEDRLVKHAFREWSRSCTCPPRQPFCTCGGDNALGDVVTRKAVVAAAGEIVRNARARSAKLRAWRRRAGRRPSPGK